MLKNAKRFLLLRKEIDTKMICHWDEFTPGPTPPLDKRMHVTLSRRSVILLSGNIHDLLGCPDAVVLLFDKVNSVIGVNPVPPSKSNAFILKPKTTGRQRLIRAAPFCKHHNIRVDQTTAFLNPEIDEDGVLRLDLRATTPTERRSRIRRKQ
ncbi:MAG: hypothetical protein LC734_04620 [Acidobacteria bacterium]|nr:hypothetical protein [Acidobacteriota bacterium]